MKHSLCFLALLCLTLSSCAQSATTVKPLTIGDTIPFIILTDVVNLPVKELQLPNPRASLTILDFWATWCGSCLKNFPKLDSAQQKFAGQLQVILVNDLNSTGNSRQQVMEFIKTRSPQVKALNTLPVFAASASILKQLFPHSRLPHYVWIGQNGKIIAITGTAELTTSNIKAAIEGRPLFLPVKNDHY